jgi:hypothetical protein
MHLSHLTNPTLRSGSAGRGVDAAMPALTSDVVWRRDGLVVLFSAVAVAGLAQRRRAGRARPVVLSCGIADEGSAVPRPTPDRVPEPEPEPEPDPDPVPVESDAMAEFYASGQFLDAALQDERAAARAHARRARHIAAARTHGERAVMLSDGHRNPDLATTRWSTSEIAYRGFVPQVACTLRISEGAAETLITTSSTLVDTFPSTLAALEAGDIGYRNAETLVRHSYRVPDDKHTEYETILLPFARTLTPAAFDNKARRVADSYLENPLQQRHEDAMTHRQVTVEACDDGMAELRLYGDAVDIYAAYHRLTDIGRDLLHPADGRTLTQLRLDAATTLLLTGTCHTPGTTTPGTTLAGTDLAGAVHGFDPTAVGKGKKKGGRKGLGVGIRPTVSIMVPVMSVLGHSDEPATLAGYGPIDPQRARELMGNDATSFTRILTDPETGAILSIGTTKYKIPAAMRMFLLTRDVRCRFPGCTTPARFCELDHTIDWQYGGPTDILNLACLCKKHHDLKHNTTWTYSQNKFGVITWVTPTGETHITEPENWIQAPPAIPPPAGHNTTTPWDVTGIDEETPPDGLPF